jgi:hypothetical protein
MVNDHDEQFMKRLTDAESIESERAPSSLKAKVYSALLRRQAESGPLASLTESARCGHELCIFEQIVRISPVGESVKCLNICRVCHARVLAEHMDNPPIYWPGCPYVGFKKS